MFSGFIFDFLLSSVAWAVAASWLVASVVILRRVVYRPWLAARRSSPHRRAGHPPPVSVLVPARDEEHRVLTECLASILRQDYDRFEIIGVDDCSTDATAAILHRISRADKRLRVIDGAPPPPGWLGKPHALRQALAASGGEWILLTDADIIFAEEALRTAVEHAERGGFDALTLIPHVACLTFWERVFMPTCWGVFMMATMPIERVNDPRRRDALGIGGFFLIRRRWLERIGGFDAVRAEVLEDIRLAELLKTAGARLRIEHAPTLVSTRMLTNFRQLWQGYTKNLFAGMRFSLPAALTGAIAVFMFAVLPVVVAVICFVMTLSDGRGAWAALLVPASAACGVQFLTHAVINRGWGVPVAYALSAPLAYALFALILVNSAVRVVTGRGVIWKGRAIYDRAGVAPPRRAATAAKSNMHYTAADEPHGSEQ